MKNENKLQIALIKPPIAGHTYRGIGVYTDNLFQSLQRINNINVSLLNYHSKFNEYDIVHYPYFDPFFLTLPLIKVKPTVVTIHDLIPLKFSKEFPKGIKGSIKWQIQKISLGGAKAILTDSMASKQDIMNFTHIPADKINVVYLGVSQEFFKNHKSLEKLQEVKNRLMIPDKFILHVGDVNYNKNIIGLIKSFHKVHESFPYYKLVLIGKGFQNDSRELRQLLSLNKTLTIDKFVMMLSNISPPDLIAIYQLADVYIQPSFSEGFGLPVIEAMAVGCPVVVSNILSLKEIASDAALFVDPDDPENISKGIIDVITNYEAKDRLIKRGNERAKLFTWIKCAEKTAEVYKSVYAKTQ